MEVKMRTIVFLIIFSLITLISCEKDDSNPVSSEIETFFTLYFDVDTYDTTSNVDVNFMTTNLSEIPSVLINGQNITRFDLYAGSIQAYLNNLDYSDTFNYSITADGKTTSGTINMPSKPFNVSCNGVLLDEEETVWIDSSSTYNFSWSCNEYDYFYCYLRGNDNIKEYTQDTSITYSNGNDYYKFGICSYVGSTMVPGDLPNVTGDYGKGYIIAESDYEYYYFNISGGMLTKKTLIKENKEKKIEEFRRKFIELVKNY